MLAGWRQDAYKRQIDLDFLGDLEDKPTWVFEAPFHERHFKGGLGGELVPVDVHLQWYGDRVGGAVEGENSGDLKDRITDGMEGAGVVLWSEGDVRKFGGLKDVVEHLLVSARIAGVATRSRNDDEARERRVCTVEVNGALFDVKAPIGGVVVAGQGEGYSAGIRIDVEGLVLGDGEACGEEEQKGKEGACGRLHRMSP